PIRDIRSPPGLLSPPVLVAADVEDGPRNVIGVDRHERAAIAARPVPIAVVVDIEVRAVAEEVVVAVIVVDHVDPLFRDVVEAWLRAVHDHRWRRRVRDEDAEAYLAPR